jgi:uncharacterized protein YlzI (FlbEa/FlbD family)
MAKFIYVTDFNKGFQILLNADQIESARVLEIKHATRTEVTMADGRLYHVHESLETLRGLSN